MTVFLGSVEVLSRMTGRRNTARSFRFACRTDRPVMCGTGDGTTTTTSTSLPDLASDAPFGTCLMTVPGGFIENVFSETYFRKPTRLNRSFAAASVKPTTCGTTGSGLGPVLGVPVGLVTVG